MEINATSPTSTTSSSGLAGSKELDREAFMKLLVSQLENQDPMEPVKNEDFVAQLATFSSLEQLESMNSGIEGLLFMSQADSIVSQLAEGSALIGKEIGWTDPDTGAGNTGIVDSVKVQDGIASLISGPVSVPLFWVETVHEAGADGGSDAAGTTVDNASDSETDTETSA
ncbi:flagellar hook capping FlgD N-terminal domain-containing protein [Engelhardtia mirabilis]|uniref:Basal-body rod modification protein FlgD n=1 Tax=Engelhardtia mirabilis TaxID=2528011 RepID=A0A518BSY6_9BACT|nr:Basal-body rod modification protein FlgD [Planctomycetes bacterium Pla133]QDV04412.1 Basal-body rod modification protein FlgD [Planctomycetes bacterium Pla86]